MSDVRVGGHDYKFGKLNALEQFHIMRRLTGMLGKLGPIIGKLKGLKGLDDLEAVGVEVIGPLGEAFAGMSDADADHCLFGLLKVVERKHGQGVVGYGPVVTGNALMFVDMTMPVMLQLAWKSLAHNMAGFLAALPSDLKEVAQTANEKSPG